MAKDFYGVLGVSKNVTDKEIKAAYRKKALEWHPDRNKSAEAAGRFKEINQAYEVLSDPKKKQMYDQFGHAAFTQGAGGAGSADPFSGFGGFGQGGGFGPFQYTYRTYRQGDNPFADFDFSDPFEIFEQFFGAGFARQRVPRAQVEIALEEAFRGVEKEVSIGGKKRTIKIPAGVDNGSRIQFNDFIAVVSVKPHKIFQREGADLIANVSIPLSIAILGGNIQIPTIEGNVDIKIKSGTQSGTMLRLSGKGMPRLNRGGRGDYYLRLNVQIPDARDLSSEQRKVLSDL